MFTRVAALFLFVALAGRVLAQTPANESFILSVGKYNLTTAQVFNIPGNPPAFTNCKSQIDTSVGKLSACGQNAACICNNDTITSVQAAEQCMFTYQVVNNQPNTDFRLGSTPVLGAFTTACNSSSSHIVVPKTLTALALPATWDGPTGIDLGLPGTIVGVITAFTMVIGSIITLANV